MDDIIRKCLRCGEEHLPDKYCDIKIALCETCDLIYRGSYESIDDRAFCRRRVWEESCFGIKGNIPYNVCVYYKEKEKIKISNKIIKFLKELLGIHNRKNIKGVIWDMFHQN